MKTLTTTLFLILMNSVVFAQVTYGNFKVSDQEIIYQKVFTKDSISIAALEKYYSEQSYISGIERTSDGLKFAMNNINVDYKKFQFSQVNTHISMQTGTYSGKVAVNVKDGRYRVTVTDIQFTGNLGYKMLKEKEPLTRYATKNSATAILEDWCKPNVLGLLDKAFTDKLELKASDEEW
jgi:hypothetical protein